ncbi:fused MFS/spermidine synthase, partial [Streptomyces lonegramiae]
MTTPPSPPVADDPPSDQGLGQRAAVALVFGSSAAVLVVEIVALRLLAPYLGLTLETSTMVIGIALTAIALGSWLGGRAADQVDPYRLIGP